MYRQFILENSNDSIAADDWANGLFAAAQTLQNIPARCPRIPEQKRFAEEVHQLLYASHRLLFWVEANTVHILRVYPCAGRPLASLHQRTKYSKRR
jgi:hypothetical protein